MQDIPLKIKSLNSVNTKYHTTPTKGLLALEIRKNPRNKLKQQRWEGSLAVIPVLFLLATERMLLHPLVAKSSCGQLTAGKNTTEGLTMFPSMDHLANDNIAG